MATNLIKLTILSLVSALLLVACGGDGEKFPQTVQVRADGIQIIPVNSELVVGENRFAIGLLGTDGQPIVDADVHFSFYELNEGEELRFEMDAVSRVPARDAGITEQVEHVHVDGTRHTHFNVGEEVGIYTAMVNFDEAGLWGVEIGIEKGDISETLLPRFNVIPVGTTPPVGADAPRSENLTVDDVEDLSQIDTSAEPTEELHTSTIKEAIEAGRPTLVLFAVPGFCTSRLCGPELAIMRNLHPEWRDRVEFIHVEFFEDPGQNTRPVQAAKDWGLRTEPWFFLIDANGKVAAKFEGPTSEAELVEALGKVATSS